MNKVQLLVIGIAASILSVEQVQLRDISQRIDQLIKAQPSADMIAAKAAMKLERDFMAQLAYEQQAAQNRAAQAAKAFGQGVTRDMNSLEALAPDYNQHLPHDLHMPK